MMSQLEEFKDPKFHALPLEEKQQTLNNYFNYMVKDDTKFAVLPEDEQTQTRDNFVNSQIGFGDKRKASQTRMDKIDEYIPDFAEDFIHGSAKNIADYTASGAKFFGADELQKKARIASITLDKNIDNEYVGMAGEMLGDPLNLAPGGIFTKGTKLARVGKSMLGGTAVGAGTMTAKNYGNESLTELQKDDEMLMGAGIVSALNGIIAGVTKGRVTGAIKDMSEVSQLDTIIDNHANLNLTREEATKAAPAIQKYINSINLKTSNSETNGIAQNIMKNSSDFGIGADKAKNVSDEIVKTEYPKVSNEFKFEDTSNPYYANRQNYILRPNHPPATLEQIKELDQIEKGFKELEAEIGGVDELKPKGMIEEPKSLEQQLQEKETFAKVSQRKADFEKSVNNLDGAAAHEADVAKYMQDADVLKQEAQGYAQKAQVLKQQKLDELMTHPRIDELLKMRQDVLAKDIQSPQKLVQKGGGRELDGYGGTDKNTYDKAVYERNYNYDFELTKEDVSKIRAGKYDNSLIAKLETDLGTLDNHPDYAPQTKGMSDTDWDEANALFSKGIDNAAVGVYAGVETDEDGNISFDEEKFLVGLGGYTAVKMALKNKQVQGKLKEYAQKAIDVIDMNPQVHKESGLNAMFVGSKGNEKGSFSDVATKKTMKEIDDSTAFVKSMPKELNAIKDEKHWQDLTSIREQYDSGAFTEKEAMELFENTKNKMSSGTTGTHQLDDVLEHKELFEKYPKLSETKVTFVEMPENTNGYFDVKANEIVIDSKLDAKEIKSTLLHEIQHSIQNKEGFAKGGSSENIATKDLVDTINAQYGSLPSIEKIEKEFLDGKIKTEQEMQVKIVNLFNDGAGSIDKLKFDTYQRLLGEQQARATQYRAKMTPEQKASETWQDTLKRVEGEYNEPLVKFYGGAVQEHAVNLGKNNDTSIDDVNVLLDKSSKPYLHKSLSDATWKKEFDLKKVTDTAKIIDVNGNNVDITYNQMKKMVGKARGHYLGLIRPTIEDPTIILKHDDAEVYISRFYDKNMKEYNLFAVSKDHKTGNLTLTSVVQRRNSQIKNKILEGEVTYIKDHGSVDGTSSSRVTSPNQSTDSLKTIIPQENKNLKANGTHSLAGAFAGGADSVISQRDYNNDGVYDYKDLLAGVAAGTISINALKKMTPKLFDDGVSEGGVKIGAFDGDAFKNAKAKGYEHVRKIISDESLKEWGDAASHIKRGFTDTLGAEYHKVREGATAAVNGQTIKLERLHNALKELSDADRTALHNYVAGESKTIDKALEPLARKIKADIHALSSELVEKKVLTEEAFKEWEHHYLHRSYEKHFMSDVKSLLKDGFKIDEIFARGKMQALSAKEADKFAKSINAELLNRPLKDGGVRLKNLSNGKVELRRDWTKAEREAMGEITDGAITLPETLMRLHRMVENARLLEEASNLDGIVLKDGHLLPIEDLNKQGYAVAPNSGKYGVVAGKAIRKDVLDDIRGINNQIFNTFGEDGAGARLWKGYLSTWKKSKTVWNVPSHMNNFMSNTFLMHLAGMGSLEITTAVGRAGKMMVHGKAYEELLKKKMLGTATAKNLEDLAHMGEDLKYFIEAKEGGLLGRSDLNDILSGNQNEFTGDGLLSKLDKFAQNSYHNGDSINRIAMYSHLRDKVGLDVEEARKMVLTVMPDYSKPMPRAYQWMRDTGVAPFVSWSYYTMPAIYKMIKTKQGATQAVKALGTLAALEWALTGGEITPLDNIPFMDTKKPDDFKGRRFGVWASGDKVTTIKTDRWIPYMELLNPINFVTSMFSGPPIKATVNILSSGSKSGMQDTYSWRPVTHKKDAGRFYDYFKYLVTSYIPLPAQAYTGWDIVESNIKDKKKRKTNEVIVPRTPIQEAVKFGGLNSLDFSLRGVKGEQKNKK